MYTKTSKVSFSKRAHPIFDISSDSLMGISKEPKTVEKPFGHNFFL